MTADHIDRAAQIIAATDAAERGYELDASDVAIGHTIAMSLDAAGLLASPEHDAAVAARAWDEAVAAVAWAMDHGPEPLRYVGENNPYKREAGERDE